MTSKSRNKKLSEREHILQRSGMYLGNKTLKTMFEYIIENDKFKYTELMYVPGLVKICNELIDNSLDEYQRTGGEFADKIDINMTSDTFSVVDNGRGIPVVDSEDEFGRVFPEPELVWTHARAGSNFDDDEKNDNESATIGTNGVGSMIASVFSTSFIGVSDDGYKRCKVTCKNNNESINTTYLKSSKPGVSVTIKPDLDRFGLDKIDSKHIDVIKQRIFMLSVSYPGITFKFNGKKVKITQKQFVDMFGGEEAEIIHNKNYTIAILPNPSDDFRHYTILNGLNLRKGGTHVNHITHNIVTRIRAKLQRKYKSIKPGDIKNKLFCLTIFNKFPNADWDGQTKEDLANSTKDINNYLGDIDYDAFVNKILRNKDIISPITEIYEMKEELQRRKDMKNLGKSKKRIKSEKYLPSTGIKKYLLVTEGASATGGLMPVLGRKECGYFELKGMPLNAYSASQQKFTANKELTELYQIIINEGYEYIIYATDQDLDGFHIRGLLNGFFHRYLSDLKGSIGILNTPVIGVKKAGKLVRWTYNLSDQVKLKPGEVSKYYKGLGSWKEVDLKHIVKVDGLAKMIELLEFDSDEIMDDWLNDKKSDVRKKYIAANSFDITKV